MLEAGELINVPAGTQDLSRQCVGPATGDVRRTYLGGGIVCLALGFIGSQTTASRFQGVNDDGSNGAQASPLIRRQQAPQPPQVVAHCLETAAGAIASHRPPMTEIGE